MRQTLPRGRKTDEQPALRADRALTRQPGAALPREALVVWSAPRDAHHEDHVKPSLWRKRTCDRPVAAVPLRQ